MIENAIEELEQHGGQLLEGGQTLPSQLADGGHRGQER
jgi:hypothetical protein